MSSEWSRVVQIMPALEGLRAAYVWRGNDGEVQIETVPILGMALRDVWSSEEEYLENVPPECSLIVPIIVEESVLTWAGNYNGDPDALLHPGETLEEYRAYLTNKLERREATKKKREELIRKLRDLFDEADKKYSLDDLVELTGALSYEVRTGLHHLGMIGVIEGLGYGMWQKTSTGKVRSAKFGPVAIKA